MNCEKSLSSAASIASSSSMFAMRTDPPTIFAAALPAASSAAIADFDGDRDKFCRMSVSVAVMTGGPTALIGSGAAALTRPIGASDDAADTDDALGLRGSAPMAAGAVAVSSGGARGERGGAEDDGGGVGLDSRTAARRSVREALWRSMSWRRFWRDSKATRRSAMLVSSWRRWEASFSIWRWSSSASAGGELERGGKRGEKGEKGVEKKDKWSKNGAKMTKK